MVLELSITLVSYLSKFVKDKAWVVFCVFSIVYDKNIINIIIGYF